MFEKRKVPLSRRLAVHVAKKAPGRWNERCNVWRSGLGPCAAANVATVNSPLPCARCHAADAPLTRAGRHRLRRLRQVPTRTSGRLAPFSVLARPCSASTHTWVAQDRGCLHLERAEHGRHQQILSWVVAGVTPQETLHAFRQPHGVPAGKGRAGAGWTMTSFHARQTNHSACQASSL